MVSGGVGVGVGAGVGEGAGFGEGVGVFWGAGVGVGAGTGVDVPVGAEQLTTMASRTRRERTRCMILWLATTSCLLSGTGALPWLLFHCMPLRLFSQPNTV